MIHRTPGRNWIMTTWDCYDGTGYRLGSVKAEDLDDAFVAAEEAFEVSPAHVEPAEVEPMELEYPSEPDSPVYEDCWDW